MLSKQKFSELLRNRPIDERNAACPEKRAPLSTMDRCCFQMLIFFPSVNLTSYCLFVSHQFKFKPKLLLLLPFARNISIIALLPYSFSTHSNYF